MNSKTILNNNNAYEVFLNTELPSDNMITNVWIIDKLSQVTFHRGYEQASMKENCLFNDFISYVFAINLIDQPIKEEKLETPLMNLFYFKNNMTNVIVSTNKEKNIEYHQLIEFMEIINLKYCERFSKYNPESIKINKSMLRSQFDAFGEEIDLIYGLSSFIQNVQDNDNLNIFLNNNISAVVKNIFEKLEIENLNPEISEMIQSNLDNIEPLIEEIPIEKTHKKKLKQLILKIRNFIEVDDWLTKL